VDADVAQIALDRKILEVAVAAMELQRLVADLEPGVGGEALRHRAMQGRIGVAVVEAGGGAALDISPTPLHIKTAIYHV
jgi:hypothetical protein